MRRQPLAGQQRREQHDQQRPEIIQQARFGRRREAQREEIQRVIAEQAADARRPRRPAAASRRGTPRAGTGSWRTPPARRSRTSSPPAGTQGFSRSRPSAPTAATTSGSRSVRSAWRHGELIGRILSSWPGIAVERTASLTLAYARPSTSFRRDGSKDVDARDKPGHDDVLTTEHDRDAQVTPCTDRR